MSGVQRTGWACHTTALVDVYHFLKTPGVHSCVPTVNNWETRSTGHTRGAQRKQIDHWGTLVRTSMAPRGAQAKSYRGFSHMYTCRCLNYKVVRCASACCSLCRCQRPAQATGPTRPVHSTAAHALRSCFARNRRVVHTSDDILVTTGRRRGDHTPDTNIVVLASAGHGLERVRCTSKH